MQTLSTKAGLFKIIEGIIIVVVFVVAFINNSLDC